MARRRWWFPQRPDRGRDLGEQLDAAERDLARRRLLALAAVAREREVPFAVWAVRREIAIHASQARCADCADGEPGTCAQLRRAVRVLLDASIPRHRRRIPPMP